MSFSHGRCDRRIKSRESREEEHYSQGSLHHKASQQFIYRLYIVIDLFHKYMLHIKCSSNHCYFSNTLELRRQKAKEILENTT